MQILPKGSYFGEDQARFTSEFISLSRYEYTRQKTDWHYHENPYFMYVMAGKMIDGNKRGQTRCPAGSLMLTNWQEAHYGEKISPKASGFHLEFDWQWLHKMGLDPLVAEGSLAIEQPEIHLLFARLYHEFSLADDCSAVAVEELLIRIWSQLSKNELLKETGTPAWARQLTELLQDDITSPLSLNTLAEQLGVHPVYISRAAPKYLGTTVGEYARQLKLKASFPLLLAKELSLTEVAYRAGFADQSHFNRVFKHRFLQSPGQFRKQLLD